MKNAEFFNNSLKLSEYMTLQFHVSGTWCHASCSNTRSLSVCSYDHIVSSLSKSWFSVHICSLTYSNLQTGNEILVKIKISWNVMSCCLVIVTRSLGVQFLNLQRFRLFPTWRCREQFHQILATIFQLTYIRIPEDLNSVRVNLFLLEFYIFFTITFAVT